MVWRASGMTLSSFRRVMTRALQSLGEEIKEPDFSSCKGCEEVGGILRKAERIKE